MEEDPAALRRRLRSSLKQLRARAGLTQREVAQALDWSPSKVIRIESGQVGISVTDLRALAAHYSVDDDHELQQLADMAKGSRRQPFAEFRGVLAADTIRFLAYEMSASVIRHVYPLVIPDLLQTDGYTRALLKAFNASQELTDAVIETRRITQQLIHQDRPPRIFTLLDESVLRRLVGGPEVMREQLRHLLSLSADNDISIRVIPFEVGAHEALQGPFIYLEFPETSDPDVLLLDNLRGNSTFTDDPEVTAQHLETILVLEEMAAPPTQLPRYVARAIESFEHLG